MRRLAVGLVLIVLVVTGCSSKNTWLGGDKGKPSAASATISSPADGATGVPTSAEIVFKAPADATVSLADADGKAVEGAMRTDGSSWVPATQLRYATKYTAKISGGKDVSFTTMSKPANPVHVSSAVGDDQVVGVAAPIVITFAADVAKDQRANVQRRLFVTSDPPQEGSWYWFNGHEVHYRSKEYWQSGTKLSFRIATGGLAWGGGRYGDNDVNVHLTVGPKILMSVDNATKQMTVTQDGQVLRTMPVSLGKPSTPSSSGNMVIMVKNEWEWFDSGTFGIPADTAGGYRKKVYWTMRLTWGGQYIHAAPWSVADQGKRNVSHACTNISTENADWLWHLVHIGDPVVVKGTERGLTWGDGWTDWNISWDQYLKGSAIGSANPSPSPSSS